MSRKKVDMENAHIYPRARGGTDDPDNIRRTDKLTHRSYDRLYGLLKPLDALEYMLGIVGRTFRRNVRRDITEAIRENKDKGDEFVYKDGVWRKK